MEPSLINLLPLKRIHAFRRVYFVRLATTTLAVGTFVVLVHAVLLVPSYTYLAEQILTREAKLKGLSAIQTPEQQTLSAQVSLFEKNASRLRELDVTTAGSDVLRALLAVPHDGITISGFTYTPDAGTSEYHLLIMGTAATREALRQYDNALGALSFIHSVDLPIAAYAKETAIPFTLTLTGTKP